MKVLNEYPTHHYIDEYEKSQLFCPNCGKRKVWQEQSPGDYYCGPSYLCESCGANFSIQGPDVSEESHVLKEIQQIRSGVTLEPTTPRGH